MKFCFDTKDFIESNIQPNKLAIIGEDFNLTWEEFSTKVNALCDTFIANGLHLTPNPVMIYGHKSANMLVAFYAMMKLEVAYIPLDKFYPKERLEKIAGISQSEVVINTTSQSLQLENTTEVQLEETKTSIVQSAPVSKSLEKSNDPLVYIIFTSGSTGEPKGVQISSEAVQSFTRWMSSDFGFDSNDVFINTAVLSFDLSVFEVMTFGKLGATLLLNNKTQTGDPNLLIPRIEQYNGSIWVSTPSFTLIYSRIKNESRLDSVHTFLFCGEVLPVDVAQKLIANYPKARLLNTYGPTEATVATTLLEITTNIIENHKSLPVGISKPESELIIQDGEIIIVGPNVSKGYVNNAALNAEKFITINNQRAFKTGDHGYLEDGLLFFTGRNDDLVKLHGFRIELNEISSALQNLDYIVQGETIALSRNGSVKKIVSLVKTNGDEAITVAQIKEDISAILPPYMLPSDIKFVDEIPLSPNGKADKKLLTQLYMKR